MRVSSNGRSMGVALSSCTVPARGAPTFELGEDEIELGIGIHGEPGRERKPFMPAEKLIETLTLSIIEDPPYTRKIRFWNMDSATWIEKEITDPPFVEGERVLAFVNGMGGTPLAELYIVYRTVSEVCKRKGLKIVRNLIGSYMTSLEMQGCSVTLLRMDEELMELWDAPVHTPALRWGV
jgi:dihydroxyacetone kinase-like protein